jgi:hypothetical protein
MDGVKNRVAVLEKQLAADRSDLHMRSKRTAPIIQGNARGLCVDPLMQRLENNRNVLDSAVTVNQKRFVGDG